MRGFFALIFTSFVPFFAWSGSLKDGLWYVSYDEAWQMARVKGKPIYLLVANESADPWQMSLFERVEVRNMLKEGFVPLFVSPYEDLSFRLPIKSLPATFIISPTGKVLLSYQGLLWESEFFHISLPLSSLEKEYNKISETETTSNEIFTNSSSSEEIQEKSIRVIEEVFFQDGSFRFDGIGWKLSYQGNIVSLKVPVWKVESYLLLEDSLKGVIYAIPSEDRSMSYQMDTRTEFWEPFYIIHKR